MEIWLAVCARSQRGPPNISIFIQYQFALAYTVLEWYQFAKCKERVSLDETATASVVAKVCHIRWTAGPLLGQYAMIRHIQLYCTRVTTNEKFLFQIQANRPIIIIHPMFFFLCMSCLGSNMLCLTHWQIGTVGYDRLTRAIKGLYSIASNKSKTVTHLRTILYQLARCSSGYQLPSFFKLTGNPSSQSTQLKAQTWYSEVNRTLRLHLSVIMETIRHGRRNYTTPVNI